LSGAAMPSPNKSKKGGGRSGARYDGDTSRPTQRAEALELRVENLEIQVGKLEKEVKRMKKVDAERETRVVRSESSSWTDVRTYRLIL
jgi:hypothetical protein